MAGLFGIFGGKTKYVDEADPVSPPPEKKEAFFLEPDEAQSLGNAEFMRKPITIKRTFPKTLNSNGSAFIQEVSSMEKKKVGESVSASSTSVSQSSSPSTVDPEISDRRSSDDSLDRFRQMAKDLKK